MNNEFTLTDEKNKARTAVPVFTISLNAQNYLIYSIRRDEKSDNLFISQINSSNNGVITINDLTDKETKNLINSTIKDVLEEVLVTGKINPEKLPENLTITSFGGQVEPSNFTIIEAYLFTSTKENISKLASAISKLEEEIKASHEANIPELDISKESNLQQTLETSLFPEEIHPKANLNAPVDFPTAAPGPVPVTPSPIIFEPQNIPVPESTPHVEVSNHDDQVTSEEQTKEPKQEEPKETSTPSQVEGITFINRTFNPDPNACDRIDERASTVLSTKPDNVRAFRTNLSQLQGQHTSEEIQQSLGKTRTLKPKKHGLPFPTSTAGYITTVAIVIVGLAGVAVASFFITLSIIQK